MNRVVVFVIISGLLLYNIANAERTVWYVHPDSALNTIQAGLDSCADNDIVLVAPGTYHENIVWPNAQGIHLIGELGPEYSIIDGDSAGRVITITSLVDSQTTISGFTIQNGFVQDNGAGIYCGSNTGLKITNNAIKRNQAGYGMVGYSGGGIFCDSNSISSIAYNTISGNAASSGGGVYLNKSRSNIAFNMIVANTAVGYAGYGAGICCTNSDSSFIHGNYFDDNITVGGFAADGGGIYCSSSAPIIDSCIFSNNAPDGIHCTNSSPLISKNIITGHSVFGINCSNYSSPTIITSIISNNGSVPGYGHGGVHCCNHSYLCVDSCTISENYGNGLYFHQDGNATIHHCNISNNHGYGVRNTDTVLINAESNWWGDASGPYHPMLNPKGLGDTVSNNVDFSPWLTNPGIGEQTVSSPFALNLQVAPNPFTHFTNIRYTMPELRNSNFEMRKPTLKIYDAAGRLIQSFNHESCIMNRGSVFQWDGRDDQNRTLGSGVYFIKLTAGDYEATEKVLLVR